MTDLGYDGHTSTLAADLFRRAATIADALALAFGGRSQVSYEDIGRAVAGQVNNNGLNVHGTVEAVCAAVYEATLFRGDGHYPADEPDYDAAMPQVVGACHDALSELGVDASRLPYPVYSSLGRTAEADPCTPSTT